MKAFDDKNCKCRKIVKEINIKYPDCDWSHDAACEEWRKRRGELENNNIEFDRDTEIYWSCTCPTCGRLICNWCF